MTNKKRLLKIQIRALNIEIERNKTVLEEIKADIGDLPDTDYGKLRSKTNKVNSIVENEAIERIEVISRLESHIRRLEERKKQLEYKGVKL